MKIDANSRILLFGSHPDDEAIAAGGLLQHAVAAGAKVHVVLATNGDDNPWPHRVVERRWKIEVADRMLWGMRRAQEALDALTSLGIPADCADFLHLPDQGMTELFLEGGGEVVARLTSLIEQVQPNLVISPAPFDLHPDHSSLYLMIQRALDSAGRRDVEQFCYVVHTRGYHPDWERIALELTPEQREGKRRAILAHETQMVLSRKRFLRHARAVEYFWRSAPAREVDLLHPVRAAQIVDGALVVQLQRRRRSGRFRLCTLLVALEDGTGNGQQWSIRLRERDGNVLVRNAGTGGSVAVAAIVVRAVRAELRIPLSTHASRIFLKLVEPSVFYDAAGWREIPTAIAAAPQLSFPRQSRRVMLPRIRARGVR